MSHERPPPAAERERELDAVRASDAEALVALFDRAGCACFCRYWHFEGDKNAWLERLAFGREAGIAELTESLRRTELAPHGVVAREGAAIVGWMKLTRAERVEKLYAQRVYRGLPCFAGDRRDVFTIGCVLVDPEVRGTGVAHGLLACALDLARAHGARAVEAFPRRGEHLGEAEVWMGPFPLFSAAGFEVVNDFGPYPVLRKAL
ncbi:MAG TPA: GNAT family N-acetyltransferase [Polyangiaceae bacterium]|nr:GNAT family N-acetyltransferase [Polyangiaceae bacterium]